MTHDEFIQECAMRNMAALLSRKDPSVCYKYATDCIGLANAMAEYLFNPEDENIPSDAPMMITD